MTNQITSALSFAACALAYANSLVAAQFIPLGDLPGGEISSHASAISGDGTTVVGASSPYRPYIDFPDAIRWSEEEGLVNLQTVPLERGPMSLATSASLDGGVIVGTMRHDPVGSNSYSEPFRWTASEGIVGLGYLDDGDTPVGSAGDVSADGKVIVGGSSSANGHSEAFFWTSGEGLVGLGDLPGGEFSSTATGISADGSVVVGVGTSEQGIEAFRWTASAGMVPLGDLPGGFFGSGADAISGDGSTIVGSGRSVLSGGALEAFRWTDALGMQALGDLPGGDFYSAARATSYDGTIVLGFGSSAAGTMAFVWDEAQGMRDLQEVLTAHHDLGNAMAGWQLSSASGISDDGLSLVGWGSNPDGNTEAWLVRLDRPLTAPEPGTLTLFLAGIASVTRSRRRSPS
jgi:probable HAF family extracellular repeat protein